jgi:hypothetical protein
MVHLLGGTTSLGARLARGTRLLVASTQLLVRLSVKEGLPPSSSSWLPALQKVASRGGGESSQTSALALEPVAAARFLSAFQRFNLAKYHVSKSEYVDAWRSIAPRFLIRTTPSSSSTADVQANAKKNQKDNVMEGKREVLPLQSKQQNSPQGAARVAFVITKQTRQRLMGMGYDQTAIGKMRPNEALAVLEMGVAPEDLEEFLRTARNCDEVEATVAERAETKGTSTALATIESAKATDNTAG